MVNEQEALQLINKVFEVDLSEDDYGRQITDVLQWDSFMIMAMLTEIMDKYGKKMELEKLFDTKTIGNLVVLIVKTVSQSDK